jgi:hypothetical protein
MPCRQFAVRCRRGTGGDMLTCVLLAFEMYERLLGLGESMTPLFFWMHDTIH